LCDIGEKAFGKVEEREVQTGQIQARARRSSMSSILRTTIAVFAALLASTSLALASWTASVSGTVVDVKSLQPVADATIKIYANAGAQVLGKSTSDAHGAFVIGGLRGGPYRLQFEKKGYQRTVIAGVYVRPAERMIEAAPIAMYPDGVPLPNFSMSKPCGDLVNPSETADVYIVCSE
jgi:Carboxypeptidase regulatory-like domain